MRTVREVVEEGAQELVNLVKEFEEINAKFAEPMEPEEMDKLIERQGQVQELMDAKGAWDLDSKLEMAMDALRCPPGDTPVSVISGGEKRRVALCRLTSFCSTNLPTTWTPNPWRGWNGTSRISPVRSLP